MYNLYKSLKIPQCKTFIATFSDVCQLKSLLFFHVFSIKKVCVKRLLTGRKAHINVNFCYGDASLSATLHAPEGGGFCWCLRLCLYSACFIG